MYLKSNILYFHVETPLHVGAGSGLGAIDLPIQRERSTGYPMIQASGIKGALREALEDQSADTLEAIFGPDPGSGNNKAHAGAFSPGDARILLFPVRSLKGVFAWTTSSHVLHRWARDMADVNNVDGILDTISSPMSNEETEYCFTSSKDISDDNGVVVLEDLAFKVQENAKVKELAHELAKRIFPDPKDSYWHDLLASNLVVLPDNAFVDFASYATEIITRIRIEPDTKTVVGGALWTEELLPVGTVLYSPIRSTRIRMNNDDIPDEFTGSAQTQADKVLNWLKTNLTGHIQLGGDETIGHGLVNLNWEI